MEGSNVSSHKDHIAGVITAIVDRLMDVERAVTHPKHLHAVFAGTTQCQRTMAALVTLLHGDKDNPELGFIRQMENTLTRLDAGQVIAEFRDKRAAQIPYPPARSIATDMFDHAFRVLEGYDFKPKEPDAFAASIHRYRPRGL